MKAKLKKSLSLLLLAVFLASTLSLLGNFLSYRSGGDSYSDARELAQRDTPAVTETAAATDPEQPEETGSRWVPVPVTEDLNMAEMAALDIAALQAVNPDVLGWIRIPGTEVDYPLVQGEDNDFYLEHDWQGREEYVGSIYLECMNSPELTDFNTIVYGHNMTDGSMFGSLWKYEYGENWREMPYVYVATQAGVLRYQVFATYNAEIESDTYGYRMEQDRTKTKYIDMALENSDIDTGICPEITDRILTLSTCSGMGYSVRRVVHAYLPMMEVAEE